MDFKHFTNAEKVIAGAIILLLLFLMEDKYDFFEEQDNKVFQLVENNTSSINRINANQNQTTIQLGVLETQVNGNAQDIKTITKLLTENYKKDQLAKEELLRDLNEYKIEREKAIKDFYKETLPEILESYGLRKDP